MDSLHHGAGTDDADAHRGRHRVHTERRAMLEECIAPRSLPHGALGPPP
jgi:hypothetical protein